MSVKLCPAYCSDRTDRVEMDMIYGIVYFVDPKCGSSVAQTFVHGGKERIRVPLTPNFKITRPSSDGLSGC